MQSTASKIKQRHILKLKTSRLRRSKWKLELSLEGARENGELISIADSQVLRFIRDIIDKRDDEDKYIKIKSEIQRIKQLPTNKENKRRISQLYRGLDNLLYMEDYLTLVISNNQEFDRANKGFYVNNKKFKRLLGTTGGIKNKTIVYVSEDVYDELNRRLDNGRDLNKKLIPAKLEAYKALACSASEPVEYKTTFKRNEEIISRVLVVDDCVTSFKADVIKLDNEAVTPPDVIYEKDCEMKLEDSDGFGLISPRLSKEWAKQLDDNNDYIPSGFCVRNSFCKGMLFTFDFSRFSEKVAKNNLVEDIWGNIQDINDIDIMLTGSMLKLHSSYEGIIDYLSNCDKNGYSFSVTKVIPKELENQRNLNYQFIQSLKLDDRDINDLIKPTLDELKDILGNDYRKSILFLKGDNLNEKNIQYQIPDFSKALMIEKRMMDDPFVKSMIHKMIDKKIQEAKVGVLQVPGNFQIISGDPYSLCQKIFGLEITGLLNANEFYCEYWNERKVNKVAAFRAPMTCHNNIRILRLKNNEKMKEWYRYMNRCIILNSWDTTTHAMNGADKD